MNYTYISSNKQKQYNMMIDDTKEIIRKFREISELMISRLDNTEKIMLNLSKNLMDELPDNKKESAV